MESFKRERELLIKGNKLSFSAVLYDDVLKMENIFKTGGIEQEAIDHFIFYAQSVEMMKLILRYGGDMHKLGPPSHPQPYAPLRDFTSSGLNDFKAGSIRRQKVVKLIVFLVESGSDLNVADDKGFTYFMNCAEHGATGLCKFLVEQGADSSAKRTNGGTALHMCAQNGHIGMWVRHQCQIG
jgi:hypothetical protein